MSQGCQTEKAANIPDTSSAHNLELESLSASVNKIVREEENDITVEEEVDSQSLDKMSIDTTFDLKQKIDLDHLNQTEANNIEQLPLFTIIAKNK